MTIKPDDRDRMTHTGARFYKCALQVNPSGYSRRFRGTDHDLDEEAYVDEVVCMAVDLGVEVLAVTDHNNVDSVDRFRSVAEAQGITVFPGFEVSSSEGVHVLCLYPHDVSIQTLNRYLGSLGIHDLTSSTCLSELTFRKLLRVVREQGGLAIAAHVTEDSGLLRKLSGQACTAAWKDRELLAVQIPGRIDDLGHDKAIICNTNLEYRREPGRGESLAVAVVHAKDIAKPADLAHESATCWIKMAQPSIEGLRQAFLDPDSRIRLDAPEAARTPHLLSVEWEGGFFDGQAISFSEGLNILIGGRGTGKSTVIESIRFALGLEPVVDDAKRSMQGLLKHVLGAGTTVRVRVGVSLPAPATYTVERTVNEAPVVKDEAGRVHNVRPASILSGIEIYGQHEISELTRHPDKLTTLLARFMPAADEVGQRKRQLLADLEGSRKTLLDILQAKANAEAKLTKLPGLELQLEQYKKSGVAERLGLKTHLVSEEGILGTVASSLQPIRDAMEELDAAVRIDRSPLSADKLDGLPGAPSLAKVDAALVAFLRESLKAIASLKTAVGTLEQELATAQADWQGRNQQAEQAFRTILRELQKNRIDGNDLVRLQKEIQTLTPLRDEVDALKRKEESCRQQRRQRVGDWTNLQAEAFRVLGRAALNVNKKLGGDVRVSVEHGGLRSHLSDWLRSQVSGRMQEALDAIRSASDVSPSKLAQICRQGTESLRAAVPGVPLAQADALCKCGEDTWLSLEELELPSRTTVELNVAASGQPADYRELDDLSAGQRATAVLLMLMLDAKAPLIVDQPEDDLDNRFIMSGVVPRVRAEKTRRQVIFSSHNANIPVLGDAELIVGLSAVTEGGRSRGVIAADSVGSIDEASVRHMIEHLLEGGRAAFEKRREKYGS